MWGNWMPVLVAAGLGLLSILCTLCWGVKVLFNPSTLSALSAPVCWSAIITLLTMMVDFAHGLPPTTAELEVVITINWVVGLVLHTVCACCLWIIVLDAVVEICIAGGHHNAVVIPVAPGGHASPFNLTFLLVSLLTVLVGLPAGCVLVVWSEFVSTFWVHAERRDNLLGPSFDMSRFHRMLMCIIIIESLMARIYVLFMLLCRIDLVVRKAVGVLLFIILGGAGAGIYIWSMSKPTRLSVAADLLGFLLGAVGMCRGLYKAENRYAVLLLMQSVIVCMALRYGMPYAGITSSDNLFFTNTLNFIAAVAGIISSWF